MFARAGIVGRPNVGKSTFFNCLLGRARAIVGDFAGVTRDYKEELLDLRNFQIQLVDTAGLKSSLITAQDKMINGHTLDLIKQLDIILNTLYILLFPVSGILLLVAAVTTGSKPIMPVSPTLQAHVVCSILAYSLITISSLQALLIELQIRQLKFKSQNKIVSSLPSLEIMEKLLFRIIFLSEVLLSISLVSGFFFYDNLHEQKLLHKVALSSMAWLCFAILLSGRLLKGWRGPLAIRLTWISFICLALGFVGTKFVLEYILKI